MEGLPPSATPSAEGNQSPDPVLTSGDQPSETPLGDSPSTLEAPQESAPIDETAYQAWLDKQIEADPDAFHKRVASNPKYNSVYQSNVTRAAQRMDQARDEQRRLEQERDRAFSAFDVEFSGLTAEQRETLRRDDNSARRWSRAYLGRELGAVDIQRTDMDVQSWKVDQAEAPTRARIATEEFTTRLEGLRQHLLERPDWKQAAEKWQALEAEAMREAPTPQEGFVRFWEKFLDVRADAIRAQIRRELAAETEAKIRDGVAAMAEGLDQPDVLVGVGGNGRVFASIDDARAAHARGEIDNATMRRYLARAQN